MNLLRNHSNDTQNHCPPVAQLRRMDNHILSVILSGAICWATAFILIRKIFPLRSFDFCNRIVSTIHALLAVCLTSVSVQDWKYPLCPLASEPSPWQTKALAVTLSYLIYDLILCGLFDERVNLDNAVHHIVSIVGIGAGLVYLKSGSELVAALCVSEISSPLLHMRELLKELGYRDTDLNLAVDILFAFTFSIARMTAGVYVTYMTWMADNPMLIKMMAMGLQLVSTFWFYRIVRMVRYKLSKKKTTKLFA